MSEPNTSLTSWQELLAAEAPLTDPSSTVEVESIAFDARDQIHGPDDGWTSSEACSAFAEEGARVRVDLSQSLGSAEVDGPDDGVALGRQDLPSRREPDSANYRDGLNDIVEFQESCASPGDELLRQLRGTNEGALQHQLSPRGGSELLGDFQESCPSPGCLNPLPEMRSLRNQANEGQIGSAWSASALEQDGPSEDVSSGIDKFLMNPVSYDVVDVTKI